MALPATADDRAWFSARTGYVPGPDFRGIAAKDAAGVTRGLVGYDHWMPRSAQIHIGLDTFAAGRCLLRPAFEYPFLESGLDVVVAFIPETAPSCRLARNAGFVECGRVRGGWASNEDLLLLALHRRECRFLKEIV